MFLPRWLVASRSDVEEFRRALAAVSELAVADLDDFLRTISLSRAVPARDAILRFMPALTTRYGEVAAVLAAEFYDAQRALARVGGGYTAQVVEPVAAELVVERTRFGAAHLFTNSPQGIIPFLELIADEYVKQPARDTIAAAAARDPMRPKWARVPSGMETCDWCVVMASRGFAYHSRSSAAAAELTKYHGGCDCALVVDWSPDPRLEGYDPSRYYEIYSRAAAAAEYPQLSGDGGVLHTMRRQRQDAAT